MHLRRKLEFILARLEWIINRPLRLWIDHMHLLSLVITNVNVDRMIHKIKQNFQDPTSVKALNKINENLTQVTDIMKKNITDIINRGETLQG